LWPRQQDVGRIWADPMFLCGGTIKGMVGNLFDKHFFNAISHAALQTLLCV